MKKYKYNDDGVITGIENNKDLFIRKVSFKKGYLETDLHNHPNSFEFYIVLNGNLIFTNFENKSETAGSGDIIYFREDEPHKITTVIDDTQMLLIKKIGSTKNI